jgi:hypothetical protein
MDRQTSFQAIIQWTGSDQLDPLDLEDIMAKNQTVIMDKITIRRA